MNKFIRSFALIPALLFAALAGAPPAAGQNPAPQDIQGFVCKPNTVQTLTVPDGVNGVTAFLQGAHGSYPDEGAKGGFGGYVQGNIAVSPGQVLYVWVGCIEKSKKAWGYGSGGFKGIGGFGDGGFGGGGSAVTLDAGGNQPLLVAGGGGGGGGNSANGSGNSEILPGGRGGNGGNPAQSGQDGDGGRGGCGGCSPGPDGGVGERAGTGAFGGGGGGGGGGGYPGGAGGAAVDGGSGGGGGGGASYAHPSASNVIFATSQLSKSGTVAFGWAGNSLAESDGDGTPDALDQCGASDLSPTVVIDGRDTGAPNHLDVDGCTLSDRIARLAAGASTHREFVRDVADLAWDFRRENLLTPDEWQAIVQAARQANIAPRRGGNGRTLIDDSVTNVLTFTRRDGRTHSAPAQVRAFLPARRRLSIRAEALP